MITTYGCTVVAERRLVGLLALEPALARLERTVLDALRAGGAARLLVTLQLDHRRQQRPALAATQADVTVAAPDRGLEVEPSVGHAVELGGVAHDREAARLHVLELRAEHVRDLGAALHAS